MFVYAILTGDYSNAHSLSDLPNTSNIYHLPFLFILGLITLSRHNQNTTAIITSINCDKYRQSTFHSLWYILGSHSVRQVERWSLLSIIACVNTNGITAGVTSECGVKAQNTKACWAKYSNSVTLFSVNIFYSLTFIKVQHCRPIDSGAAWSKTVGLDSWKF